MAGTSSQQDVIFRRAAHLGMQVADNLAKSAQCRRRGVGAAILNGYGNVIATGCNRAPHGFPTCLEGHCPRGLHSREEMPSGSPYTGGERRCIAVHAEIDALMSWLWRNGDAAAICVTAEPCWNCRTIIWGAGIPLIVARHGDGSLHYSYRPADGKGDTE